MLALNAFVTAAIAPSGTALIFGALAVLLGLTRFKRTAWAIGAFALAWLGLWATPWASQALRSQLENQHPVHDVQQVATAQAIVVLGGGIKPPTNYNPLPDMNAAADRVWHAARLYHAGKAPLLVLSGGSDPQLHTSSEAAAMQQLLLHMAVPAGATVLEEYSRNTRENAVYSAALLRERGIQRVLLVTSALHMPRALALFEAQGLQVLPVATDHEAEDTADWPAWRRWLPSGEALEGSGRAIKELVGRWVS